MQVSQAHTLGKIQVEGEEHLVLIDPEGFIPLTVGGILKVVEEIPLREGASLDDVLLKVTPSEFARLFGGITINPLPDEGLEEVPEDVTEE